MTRIASGGRGPVLVTVDVEDHGGGPALPRFGEALRPLLSFLEGGGICATFFVVGSLAPSWAGEIRELVAAGHEIGLHGFTHRFLKDIGPEAFRDELQEGTEVLSRIAGIRPTGFRAPYFSITRDTPWAPDIIANEGYAYSSSVLPVWNPQAGFRGAPRHPFRWESGLVEFPSPVLSVAGFGMPAMGGLYLRLLPGCVVALAERSTRASDGRWLYAHPYDFDVEEPFFRRESQSWPVARLLFLRRGRMLERVKGLAGGGAVTLGTLASDTSFVEGLRRYRFPS